MDVGFWTLGLSAVPKAGGSRLAVHCRPRAAFREIGGFDGDVPETEAVGEIVEMPETLDQPDVADAVIRGAEGGPAGEGLVAGDVFESGEGAVVGTVSGVVGSRGVVEVARAVQREDDGKAVFREEIGHVRV